MALYFKAFFFGVLSLIVIGDIAYFVFMHRIRSLYSDTYRKLRWPAFFPLTWPFVLLQISAKERAQMDLGTKRWGYLNLMSHIFVVSICLVFFIAFG